jgi:protein tyrosine/serine phosphatase
MKMKVVVSVLVFLALGGWIYRSSTFRPAENFHVVDEGKFYRMAQPTPEELEEAVRKYGIKTVINLRGPQPGEWWYDDEANALKTLGVRQVDIAFSSEHMQFKHDWVSYLDTLKTGEGPFLVHCRSGADRTSEASAVYAIEYMGRTPEKAIEEQMTIEKLHMSLMMPAKRAFVRNYKGDPWLRASYDPCAPEFKEHAGNRCPN